MVGACALDKLQKISHTNFKYFARKNVGVVLKGPRALRRREGVTLDARRCGSVQAPGGVCVGGGERAPLLGAVFGRRCFGVRLAYLPRSHIPGNACQGL